MSKTRTITLTLHYGSVVGLNDNGVVCTHADTYDGAPDSNHPIGAADTDVDAINEWMENAEHINDGDLSEYLEDPDASAESMLHKIRMVISAADDMESTSSIDDAALRAAAFNQIAEILNGVEQEAAA